MANDPMWEDFAKAVVTLALPTGSAVLRPLEDGQVGPFGFDGPVHIITAYNPAGILSDPHENEARHSGLCALLAARGYWWHGSLGSARDGSFAEPGCAVVGIDTDQALEIARHFGQRAIYVWSDESLRIIGVDEDVELSYGWELRQPPHGPTEIARGH